MKKTIFIVAAVLMVVMCTAESQAGGRYGSYGLSTRSYSSGRSGSLPSFKSYAAPAPRNYKNGGEIYLQNGYPKQNGTYVMPHYKTRPDNNPYNNLGAWGK
jgi:hypothetical protein